MVLLAASVLFTFDYGVSAIRTGDEAGLFRAFGETVAAQRTKQLDLSRAAARGYLSLRLGPTYVAGDLEALKNAYSDRELQAQLDRLPPRIRRAFVAYAEGVNRNPAFAAQPWTPLDSAAIAVRLFQTFGRGGAGELRNLALLSYLRTRPASKAKALDILDDIAPFEDLAAPTTLDPRDRRSKLPAFRAPSRAVTEAHLARLPAFGPFEMLGAARVASLDRSRRNAAAASSPFRSGSYAVAVARSRSTTGNPLLLSGPQMGFRDPSIAHEIVLDCPTLKVAGMDVPGIPAILIGTTPKVAWGLTTGVADTEDIFALPAKDLKVAKEPRRIGDKETVKETAAGGDLVFRTGDGVTAFVRRRSYAGRELASMEALFGMYAASSARACDVALRKATMNFNAVYAAPDAIGWRYTGLVPLRDESFDPRFPAPADPRKAWRRFLTADEMPHVIAPRSGLLTNWNTKPAPGWPNWDTPVWGEADRVVAIRAALPAVRISPEDVAAIPRAIGTVNSSWPYFRPLFPKDYAFDGRLTESAPYARTLDALKKRLFAPTLGDLGGEATFRTVVQDTLLLRALTGRTKVDYLAGGDAKALVTETLEASRPNAAYVPSRIDYGDDALTFLNRGTYLALTDLGRLPSLRTTLPPGNHESGPHARDQVALAQSWTYKPVPVPH